MVRAATALIVLLLTAEVGSEVVDVHDRGVWEALGCNPKTASRDGGAANDHSPMTIDADRPLIKTSRRLQEPVLREIC
jgi:hypothetical protein